MTAAFSSENDIVRLCRGAKSYVMPTPQRPQGRPGPPVRPVAAVAVHDDIRSRIPVVSDLHVNQGWVPQYRVLGTNEDAPGNPATKDAIEDFLAFTLQPHMMARLEGDDCAADGAFTDPISLEEGGFGRIRIRASKARNGLVLAIRFLCDYPPLFDELYLPKHIGDWMGQQGGLILFSGLTGSGKTTALGSCVRLSLEREMKARILSFEDPIEYIFDHKLVSQYEIGVHTPTYIEGLRGVMRGDADMVVVQEFRDGAAIEAGLHAAEQGNLVLGTIHAAAPPMVPDRIVAEFPPGKKDVIRAQLAGTLLGIVGLDLVRTRAGGARRAAFEVMDFNQRPQLRTHILNGHAASQLRNEMTAGGLASGCITKEQSLSTLIREGVITRESAFAHSSPLYHEEIKA